MLLPVDLLQVPTEFELESSSLIWEIHDNDYSFSQLSAHKALTCPVGQSPCWAKSSLRAETICRGTPPGTSCHWE